MCAFLLHIRAWVHDYVVDRRVVMHACVRDRGAWRRPYRVGRRARMSTCGMDKCTCGVNRHAYVRAYGVNKRTYVHAYGVNRHAYERSCGLKSHALRERLTGVKLIIF
jgi:hypothetical protein